MKTRFWSADRTRSFGWDPDTGKVSAGDRQFSVPAQERKILSFLIERRGTEVSPANLKEIFWPNGGTISSVHQAISDLRRLINDVPRNDRKLILTSRNAYLFDGRMDPDHQEMLPTPPSVRTIHQLVAMLGGPGRCLLGLLMMSPGGLSDRDVSWLLPRDHNDARRAILDSCLGVAQAGRLDLEPYVRAAAVSSWSGSTADRARLRDQFLRRLDTVGSKVGGPGGADALTLLSPDVPNIVDALLGSAKTAEELAGAVRYVGHYARMVRLSGIASPEPLRTLLAACRDHQMHLEEARVCEALGEIALQRAEFGEAEPYLETALRIYRCHGERLGEATCLQRLGECALKRFRADGLRKRLQEADTHFGSATKAYTYWNENKIGIANCNIWRGDIALIQGGKDAQQRALDLYEAALKFAHSDQSPATEGRALVALAELAVKDGQFDRARISFEEAEPLLVAAGDIPGQARRRRSMGDLAKKMGQLKQAAKHYDDAAKLFERVGDAVEAAIAFRRRGSLRS